MEIITTETELIVTRSKIGNYKIEFGSLIGELTEEEWYAHLVTMGYRQDATKIMKALKNLPFVLPKLWHHKVRLFDGIFWTNPDAK